MIAGQRIGEHFAWRAIFSRDGTMTDDSKRVLSEHSKRPDCAFYASLETLLDKPRLDAAYRELIKLGFIEDRSGPTRLAATTSTIDGATTIEHAYGPTHKGLKFIERNSD